MMIQLKIKPMSVNEAWQGRRFKTSDYRDYEAILCAMLPPMKVPDGHLALTVEFGLNTQADIDNPLKPFLDCLQKKYGFNDREIYQLNVTKKAVKRGDGYIKFTLKPLGN
jgi:Holliday junction resolvase RusA-like endonuclease